MREPAQLGRRRTGMKPIVSLMLLILAACATPVPPGDGGDTGGIEGRVFVSGTQILLLESYPVQVRLEVRGDVPTPCHEVRWSVEDDGETISVRLYSVVALGEVCAQVLTPFEVAIPLGDFTEGSRGVTVNESVVGEFSI